MTKSQKEFFEFSNAAVDKMAREIDPKTASNYCYHCGKEITDYEDTEFKQDEGKLIFTYKCSCGFYGEQHFKVEYERTVPIE
jgi:hypothetical protein